MRRPEGLDRLVFALGLGQITGWGTTYYLPGILGDAFEQASGLPRPLVFAGITVMLLFSSLMGVPAGRVIDRRGARTGLCVSYGLLSAGLVILSFMSGPATYFTAWMLFGIAMPFGLAGGAQAALVQDRGQGARIPISYVLMMTSLSQSIFWPLTAWLDSQMSWRTVCLIYAVMDFAVMVLLAIVIRPGPPRPVEIQREGDGGALPPENRAKALPLLILAMASSGFVSWGMELHALELLLAFGITQATALAIVGLRGPISMASRAADLVFGRRIGGLEIALAGSVMMFVSLIAAAVGTGTTGAVVFMVLFAAGTGVMTIARATLQLALFGPHGYGTLAGRIGRPAYFAYAIAPPVLGLVTETFGVRASVSLCMLAMAMALAALLSLRRMTQPQGSSVGK